MLTCEFNFPRVKIIIGTFISGVAAASSNTTFQQVCVVDVL